MKVVLALLFAVLVLASSGLALKDAACGSQPFENGRCLANKARYSYVTSSNECIKFYYGGCEGNENNFRTKEECEEKCKE